jgi:hypothetical protein
VHYQTFPDPAILAQRFLALPEYTHPNKIPYIVMVEGYLSDELCDNIITECEQLEPYHMEGCHAETRECVWPLIPALKPIQLLVEYVNGWAWKYDLDETDPRAWFQTYGWGGDYPLHMDGSAGQTRKLTGLALLTDPKDYGGGDLTMHIFPGTVPIPKTRGTVVIFPFWMWHDVSQISRGKRQTINMGFFGPPFR